MKIIDRLNYNGVELYVLDTTPGDVGVEFIYSYILVSRSKVVVVETGPQTATDRIARFLEEKGLASSEVHVAVTHIHLDHGGGVGRLARMLENSVFYVHPKGYRHLVDPDKLWQASRQALGWIAEAYGKPEPAPREKLVATSDEQELVVGDVRLVFIHTPGHASHHQSILVEIGSKSILFTGDSAGMYIPSANAITPTTPPPFRYKTYVESIDKQLRYNPKVLGFTHRGLGGGELLKVHKRQVELWRKTIESLARENPEIEAGEVFKKIIEVDPLTRKYVEETGLPELIRVLVMLSIQGFLEDLAREKG